jgi:dTDP-4-amino-4,6-dideoxygalactose transaminase
VLDSGWFILGQEVESFEQAFASYIGVAHGVGVASGTDAVELALRACGVGDGDLVYTVSHTAVASIVAIERAGATPVLCDIDPSTFNLDPASLELAIESTSRQSKLRLGQPKAILVVHLYGMPADIEAIGRIATRHGLDLVEDCAQAHGAVTDGRRVGSFGKAGAFSFYPTKNLGCAGDGGMVVTNDDAVDARLRLLRQYGWRTRFVSDEPGTNSRLDELQAAVLRVLLSTLDQANDHRVEIAELYRSNLGEHGSVELPSAGTSPSGHVFHQYVIRSRNRDGLRAHLLDAGINTAILYPMPVHLQPAYKDRVPTAGSLRHTERTCQRILSLPMGEHIRQSEVGRVSEAIRSFTRT